MNVTKELLLQICELGRFSPSAHNTQPWVFRVTDGNIQVFTNEERKLDDGDPVGRQNMISLGCVVETLVQGARGLGYGTKLSKKNDHFEISITNQKTPDNTTIEAIKKRYTDRAPYSEKPISSQNVKRLLGIVKPSGVQVKGFQSQTDIDLIATLTGKGIGLALTSPEFRKELSHYIVKPGSKRKIGISLASLRKKSISGKLEILMLRTGKGTAKRGESEANIWKQSPLIIGIFTRGDYKTDWFEAGRTYIRLVLEATKLGINNATAAAAVEAHDYHLEVEKAANTQFRLQATIRLGYSTQKPAYSPRLSLENLLKD